jgi:fatty acid amide hydrolase
MGIGTDVGGSIRVPSHFNGLYGYKPTPERMPHRGMILPTETRQEWNRAIMPVMPGPIARCVDDCVLFLDTLAQPETWHDDPYINPLPFNSELYTETAESRALTIGYYFDDGVSGYSDVIKSVILEVKERLEQRGHTLVEVKIPDTVYVGKLFLKLLTADGGRRAIDVFRGEEATWCTFTYKALYTFSHLKKPIMWLLDKIGFKTEAMFGSAAQRQSSIELLWNYFDMEAYRKKFTEWWDLKGLDVILCPAFGTPAPGHKQTELMSCLNSFNLLWNVTGQPTGVVPIRLVR